MASAPATGHLPPGRESPSEAPPSSMRAGQGARPLPRAASALGRAWQHLLHRELPGQVTGTKPKEPAEP